MTGQKLLVADDSVTIRKVIDLTFSDEGMQVVTVGDGEQAIRQLEEFTPDIVLADVLMPGPDGYRLCEFIKQSEQFHLIPVMLLVGSFEPFDEAEAHRVGADDFLTKPFQSIRQLVSRVGSLLGGTTTDEERVTRKLSTLGLGVDSAESGVGVMPEAETEHMTPATAAVSEHEQQDIELQTADTLRLRPEQLEELKQHRSALPDRDDVVIQPEPTMAMPANQATPNANMSDVLLDLDELDAAVGAPDFDDAILDIEFETPIVVKAPAVSEQLHSPLEFSAATSATVAVAEGYQGDQTAPMLPVAGVSDWAPAAGQAKVEDRVDDKGADAEDDPPRPARQLSLSELSPEAVDAIAQRVVERLGDKVVREIAWEVVPELAELLIRQRLEEQKS